METNLEKAKRLVYDHAYAGGIELPEDGFLFKMLELAATPDPSNPINNDLHTPDVSESYFACDVCGCHPSVIIRTAFGAFCELHAKYVR